MPTQGGVSLGYYGDVPATGNTIRGNAIHGNSGLGINLYAGGEADNMVTRNDLDDADGGANGAQNFPVITRINTAGGKTKITGALLSTAGAKFLIDFYRSAAADASGYGEGQTHLGSTLVTTDAKGKIGFAFTLDKVVENGFLTATATNMESGDTSEFSLAVGVGVKSRK